MLMEGNQILELCRFIWSPCLIWLGQNTDFTYGLKKKKRPCIALKAPY
jgi:hypothetical protein